MPPPLDPSEWRRNYRRLVRHAAPRPVVRADDGRRLPDGSGPRRRAWGASGLVGAYERADGTFQARLSFAGRLYHCGIHATAEEAAKAVEARREELRGRAS